MTIGSAEVSVGTSVGVSAGDSARLSAEVGVGASTDESVGDSWDDSGVDTAVGSGEVSTDDGNGDGIPSCTSLQLGSSQHGLFSVLGFRFLSASNLAIAAARRDCGASSTFEASTAGAASAAGTLAILNSPASGAGAEADGRLEVEAAAVEAAAVALGISAITRALLSSIAGATLSAGRSVVYAAPGSGAGVGTE